MQPLAAVDYVKILMLLVEEKETLTKPLKKPLITSNKFKTTVHDSGCHYPIKISAPYVFGVYLFCNSSCGYTP